jgi:hypothetical protein
MIKVLFSNLDSFSTYNKKETISIPLSIEITDFILTIKDHFSMNILITIIRGKDGKMMSSNNIQDHLKILKREAEEDLNKKDFIPTVICISELLFRINC